MLGLVTIYAWLWAFMIFSAPIACVYGLINAPTPLTRRRSVGVAISGLLLSALLALGSSTTTLVPLAAAIVPAPLIFAMAVFLPLHSCSEGATDLPDFLNGCRGAVLDMGGVGTVRSRSTIIRPSDFWCVTMPTNG